MPNANNGLDVKDSSVPGRGGDIAVRDYQPTDRRAAANPFVWIHGGGVFGVGLDQRDGLV